MRTIGKQFTDILKLSQSIEQDTVEAENNLAEVYRQRGNSSAALARAEFVKHEYVYVTGVARGLRYLARGTIDPLHWVRTEKYIRDRLRDAFEFYENQNVLHPQVLVLQYPPEWEPKLQ